MGTPLSSGHCSSGWRQHLAEAILCLVRANFQKLLEDPDWRVRQAVLTLLPEVTATGAQDSVAVAESVAKKAGYTGRRESKTGHHKSAGHPFEALEDNCADVRETAVSCFPRLVQRGDQLAVRALKHGPWLP